MYLLFLVILLINRVWIVYLTVSGPLWLKPWQCPCTINELFHSKSGCEIQSVKFPLLQFWVLMNSSHQFAPCSVSSFCLLPSEGHLWNEGWDVMKLDRKLIKYDTRIDVECNSVSILFTSQRGVLCLLFAAFVKDLGKKHTGLIFQQWVVQS